MRRKKGSAAMKEEAEARASVLDLIAYEYPNGKNGPGSPPANRTPYTAQTKEEPRMPTLNEVDPRAQRLYERLTEVSARALSEVKGPGGSLLEFWQVGQTVVIIQFYRQGGWEMYAPLTPSLVVDDNFAALDAIRVK